MAEPTAVQEILRRNRETRLFHAGPGQFLGALYLTGELRSAGVIIGPSSDGKEKRGFIMLGESYSSGKRRTFEFRLDHKGEILY